jgi:ribonuclease D
LPDTVRGPSAPPPLIATTAALSALCARLARCGFVTVDTEFHRESTYWPKLCLVQVAGGDAPDDPEGAFAEPLEAVIDPLAPGIDLAPLFELLADGRVLKVFHAARQDIEIFVKLTGAPPANVFDTQIAAMAAGFGDSVSYENLVGGLLKRSVDKGARFTDWTRRPLSAQQSAYALADVTHLRDLYPLLMERLTRKDRLGWVAEEMAALIDPATYDTDPDKSWQRFKLRKRKPEYLALLATASAWRERTAQARDMPRQRVLKDDGIQEIAEQRAATAEAFDRLRAVPKGFAGSKFGIELLAELQKALASPADHVPEVDWDDERPRASGPVSELLRVLLNHVAEREGVAARLIASSSDLDRIALEGDAPVPALEGWRREVFGAKALALRSGRLSLTLDGQRLKVVEG